MQPQDETEQSKSNFAWPWIVLAVILALAAVGALWWWKYGNVPSAASCSIKDLALSLGETEHVNGTAYVHTVVTNRGTLPCTLEGFPTVVVQDKQGSSSLLVSQALHNPFYESSVVTLQPKAQAYVAVGLPEPEHFTAGTCSDAMATLRLYLPAEAVTPTSIPLTTDFTYRICPGFSVTVFRPGA